MKKDLVAPIRNLLSLLSRKELSYLCFLNQERPIRSRKELPYRCLLNEE